MPATSTRASLHRAAPPDVFRTGDRFLDREVLELMTPGATCISADATLRDAITERVTTISPSASARTALEALSRPGTTHLLVQRAAHRWPVGVLSDIDLVRLAAS